MDPIVTGNLIRWLRQKQGLTQLALAERIHVSDKAVSKWERGRGVPDLSLLPPLAEALGVDIQTLMNGTLEENDMSNGNLKKMRFWVCPECGNLLLATDGAEVRCCGKKAAQAVPQKPDPEHDLRAVRDDGEWYVTGAHEMTREHHIAFLALLTGDTLVLKKKYPEWGLETRLPGMGHGRLLWYCTRHGLFWREI